MGATRNTGYLENLIQYDASDNVAIATSVNPSYKVTLGGNLLGTSAVFSGLVTANSNIRAAGIIYGRTTNNFPTTGAGYYAITTNNFDAERGGITIQVSSATNTLTTALSINYLGAATFSSSAAGYGITLNHTSENLRLKMGAIAGGIINIQGEVISSGGVYPIVLNYLGGNVGIGTASPDNKLSVRNEGTGGIAVIDVRGGASGGAGAVAISGNGTVIGTTSFDLIQNSAGAYVYQRDNNPLIFGTNNTERMRITSGGNVGIGSTVTDTVSNFTTLQIDGTSGSYIRTGTSNYGGYFATIPTADVLVIANVRNPVNGVFSNTGKASSRMSLYGESGNSYITFATSTSNNTDPTERMRITSGGNVGIGTTNPTGAAGLALVLNSGASQGRICIKTSSTGDASGDGLQIGMSGNDAFIEQRENADLTFATNASERMRITSGGQVRVGTSTSNLGGNVIFSAGSSGAFGIIASAQGTGTYDTGISINQGSAGQAIILLVSRHTDAGTATSAAIYLIKCYFDGNNTPAMTFIGGDNFVTIGKSGSNTITLTTSGSAQVQYTLMGNK